MRVQNWRAIKLIRLLLHLMRGYAKVRWAWQGLTPTEAQDEVMKWSKRALEIFGAQVKLIGQLSPDQSVLLVSNHISWLDILLMLSLTPVRFVSKSEVRSWPIIGRFASACRTPFIQRASKRDAKKVVQTMRESLMAGERVAVFPEGTTTKGEEVLPFHANLFESVVATNAKVQALSILYVGQETQLRISTPSFTEDDTLVGSIWRILGLESFEIWVCAGKVQDTDGLERRALAQQSATEVLRCHAHLLSLTNSIEGPH